MRELDAVLADGYDLEVDESFDGPTLDRSLWLPHHLPHWSSLAASEARYELSGGQLHLLIEDGQPPWCPDLDGETRVSSLQTGAHAGPLGGIHGQHRFHADAVVRTSPGNVRLYTPQFGAFVVRARAVADPDAMVALWMIGYEDEPERAGEICIMEIFGRDVRADSAGVGMGLHPFGDPQLVDDFAVVDVPVDVRELHDYAGVWTPDDVRFYVDGRLVRSVGQSPQYPMQFMLGIYQFGPGTPPFPRRFTVGGFRAYRPRGTRRRADEGRVAVHAAAPPHRST